MYSPRQGLLALQSLQTETDKQKTKQLLRKRPILLSFTTIDLSSLLPYSPGSI